MQFKRHWGGQMGHTPIYRREDAACQWIEIDMLKLAVGQSFDYDEMDKEYALILLGGTGSVTGSSFAFEEIGKRGDVFGGPATAVYVPRNRAFTVTAKTELTIAVCKSPAVKDFDPVLVKPEDVIVKDLGKPGWERQAHFIIDERLDANLLYIGEAFVEGGQWASYPPHKHDEDNMPAECIAEEIYYFLFDPRQGFAVQCLYTADGALDEAYRVKNDELVEFPYGYHTTVSTPGYQTYFLWLMAGDYQGFNRSNDPEHDWVK